SGGLPVTLKTYSHAQKIFQVGNLPIGILTYGIGNIGTRSIGSYILEFGYNLGQEQLPVKDVAERLLAFLGNHYATVFPGTPTITPPPLGIYVAGYNNSKAFDANAEEWEFVIPRDIAPILVRAPAVFGAAWRGMDLPFSRLFFGVDGRLANDLGQESFEPLRQKYAFPVV